jgi:hypothetical protein
VGSTPRGAGADPTYVVAPMRALFGAGARQYGSRRYSTASAVCREKRSSMRASSVAARPGRAHLVYCCGPDKCRSYSARNTLL